MALITEHTIGLEKLLATAPATVYGQCCRNTTTNPTTATMAHQGRKETTIMARDKRNKEQAMSDTETTEATEGTEPGTSPEPGTEGTEGTQGEGTEGGDATPKPSTDELIAVLRTQVDEALANASGNGELAEGQADTLQSAYRAVPAAKRGQVQAEILRDKINEPGANHAAIATILEVMTQAPTTKTRAPKAAKPEVPEQELLAQALNALDVARQELLNAASSDEVRTEAETLASTRLAGGIEDEAQRDAVTTAAAKAVKAVTVKARKSSGGGGTGGPRVVKSEGLTDLIADGRLTEGAELKHGDLVATVTGEGKLSVNGSVFDNPTAAAKGAGVTSSVNGWDYWTVERDGKKVPVGDLRTK